MSGKTANEAETAFIHPGPSKGCPHSSTSLYVHNEGVKFPTTATGGGSEDAPLLSSASRGKNIRKRGCNEGTIICISLLVFASMLAGSVTFVSTVLLAVYPESFQGDILTIYPNDTILAVPEAGLDPGRVNYAVYNYYGTEKQQNETDILLLYKQQCNNLGRQSKVIDIDNYFPLPEGVSIVEIAHQYLLKGSSIMYHINFTLSSEAVPPYCYAELVLNGELTDEETVEICNNTAATFPVTATKNGYAFVTLLISSNKDVQLNAIHIKASGEVYYYDVIQSKAQLACLIQPPTNTSCLIPIRDGTNQISSSRSDNVCILALRESSYAAEISEFEYYMASFAYVQAILVALICVGLVSFVCMCGLSISCCTKQGMRLRVALHMSSPLNQ